MTRILLVAALIVLSPVGILAGAAMGAVAASLGYARFVADVVHLRR